MVGTRILSPADGSIPTAALPAVWVLVLPARSFFAGLAAAAAACASVTLSRSGSHAGAAAAVRLTGLTWALSSLSP